VELKFECILISPRLDLKKSNDIPFVQRFVKATSLLAAVGIVKVEIDGLSSGTARRNRCWKAVGSDRTKLFDYIAKEREAIYSASSYIQVHSLKIFSVMD
jgi:hypothetical protein